MVHKSWTIASIFITVIVLTLTTDFNAMAKTSLRLGGVHAVTSPETRGLEYFAQLVQKKPTVDLEVKVYPAGQLGDAVTMIENMMMGTQDMFANVVDWLQQLDKDWTIMAMPFAFHGKADVMRFQDSDVYAQMKDRLRQKKGIRILTDRWYQLPKVLVTRTPIFSIKDLEGKKLRMPDLKIYLETWKTLGAKVTIIPWAEAYLSLKTGVVEGLDAPSSSLYGEKFYQAAQYILWTRHLVSPFSIMISESVFKRLSPQQQKLLVEASHEAGEFYTKSLEKQFEEEKAKMLSSGAVFIETGLDDFVKRAREAALKFEAQGMWSAGLFAAAQGR
jgi:tripartite ATP-independent transporter DctP family solute receptor